jgi:hypothetical protein
MELTHWAGTGESKKDTSCQDEKKRGRPANEEAAKKYTEVLWAAMRRKSNKKLMWRFCCEEMKLMWRRRRLALALILPLPSILIQWIVEEFGIYIPKSPSCLEAFVRPYDRDPVYCTGFGQCHQCRFQLRHIKFVWGSPNQAGFRSIRTVIPFWWCRVCQCERSVRTSLYFAQEVSASKHQS